MWEWPQTVHVGVATNSTIFYRTAHVSLVLHAVASCALLAQLVSHYGH